MTNENNDLEKDEVDIVTGALVYKEKTVKHIMTGVYYKQNNCKYNTMPTFKAARGSNIVVIIVYSRHPRLLYVALKILLKLRNCFRDS